MATSSELDYENILLLPVFNGNERALTNMEGAGIISIPQTSTGRPSTVRVGTPIYQQAFLAMLQDHMYSSKMDMILAKHLASSDVKKIAGYELELKELTAVNRSFLSRLARKNIDARINHVAVLLGAAQERVRGHEAEVRRCKKELKKETKTQRN